MPAVRSIPQTVAVPAARPAPKLRLTRRGRAVFATLAAVPLIVGATFFAVTGGATVANAGGEPTFVTVSPGDSLWNIAEELAPSHDTREVVAQILRMNHLQTAQLQPGQELAVPAQFS